jgi:dihydrofolate synthase/folylpolyglutamate synthase
VTYDEAVAWLYSTQLHGIKLGLENVHRLAAALEITLSGSDAPRFLHIAGTNGKGSTCAMLDAICRAGGMRTGLFTSPHLITFRERLRLNGQMISENEVVNGLATIRSIIKGWEHSPTFFEITTALALAWFQRAGAEIVILETGMGGRLDATNIVTPIVSVITPIALDHQQWLGATLQEIAAEKAGIIKAGVPVVSAPQSEDVHAVLLRVAHECGAPFQVVDAPFEESAVNLAGQHQRWNAALAMRALEIAGLRIDRRKSPSHCATCSGPGVFNGSANGSSSMAHTILRRCNNLRRHGASIFPTRKRRLFWECSRTRICAEFAQRFGPLRARYLPSPSKARERETRRRFWKCFVNWSRPSRAPYRPPCPELWKPRARN